MPRMAYIKRRKFDGKYYTASDVETRKDEAERLKRNYKRDGYKVRITRHRDPEHFTGTYYTLWIRR